MATLAEAIRVEFASDTTKLRKDLSDVRRETQKTTDSMGRNVSSVIGPVTKLAGAIGGLLTIKEVGLAFFDTARELERLRAMMATVTGGTQNAQREFSRLKSLAQTLPRRSRRTHIQLRQVAGTRPRCIRSGDALYRQYGTGLWQVARPIRRGHRRCYDLPVRAAPRV